MQSRQQPKILTGFIVFLFIILSVIACFAEMAQEYIYDDLNRLKQVQYDDGTTIIYSYDEVGNRTQKTVYKELPMAPTNLIATTISSSKIDLRWTDNSTDEIGFKIERKTVANGIYTQIATPAANTTAYSDTGLTAETTYYYRIRAYSTKGDSTHSNVASAMTAPNAPTNLTATIISSSKIVLRWTDNSTTETGFKIERKIGSGDTYTQYATVEANISTVTNVGLTAGTTYYYRVRAYNAGGDSTYSNEAYATTSSTVPNAPTNLAATAVFASQINLSWTDNATDETGFKVERKTGTGGAYSQIATQGANVTTYSDTGLTAGTTYYYRVRAYNSVGDSAYCTEVYATTLSTVPNAPSGLTATAVSSSQQINLSWIDNSTNETGFKIERKTGTGGSYSQIATVSANVTTYSNTGLTAGTTYYYRVRAYNAAGDSGYSNEAYATTSGCSNLPVRLARATPVYYSTLQAAYNAAVNGDIIQSQAITFYETLSVNRNISVTLQGGYDCNYTTNSGNISLLKGLIQTFVGGGTLTISNFNLIQ